MKINLEKAKLLSIFTHLHMKSNTPILLLVFVLLYGNASYLFSQNASGSSLFKDVVLRVDTASYNLLNNSILYNGDRHIYFNYDNSQSVCEINLFAFDFDQIEAIRLHPSGDYEILDSLIIINEEYARGKVRFKNLNKSNFINFTITVTEAYSLKPIVHEFKLLPVTKTIVNFHPDDLELYIGEEKIFELITNNLENIRINYQWTTGNDIDYKFSEKNGQLRLHLLPNSLGKKTIAASIETYKPFLDDLNRMIFHYPKINQEFNVKSSRLGFLNIDKKEVSLVPGTVTPIEVQLDNNRLLQLQKTYRIENQEQPGGALIAEIFTRNSLNNDRVLCYLRVYAYHKKTDGYLYIKDGDEAKFITNFSITPIATINKVSVLRNGGEWISNLNVSPGETIDVKIEGQGLHKANFHFDGATKVASDSLIMNENLAVHKVNIPMTVNKNKISIYNNTENTGHSLSVKEFQKPHPLNFVTIDYGAGDKVVTGISKSILYDKNISEITIAFKPELLDNQNKLHGKQYLEVEIRVTGPRNELIEMKVIDDIVVCPSENSPRHSFYSDAQCVQTSINLNNYIGRKTYNLDDWSRIQIQIRHKKDRYGGEGYTERVEIILQKHVTFDIDVSFPAGLITKKIGDENQNFSSLGGISMAMIAQFSFYRPNKIAQYRPYRIGAGFIALDAFNFSASAASNRDVGVVAIGTLYPARRDVKLSFPLNLGGGFLMQESKWFFLIGPGIRVRL